MRRSRVAGTGHGLGRKQHIASTQSRTVYTHGPHLAVQSSPGEAGHATWWLAPTALMSKYAPCTVAVRYRGPLSVKRECAAAVPLPLSGTHNRAWKSEGKARPPAAARAAHLASAPASPPRSPSYEVEVTKPRCTAADGDGRSTADDDAVGTSGWKALASRASGVCCSVQLNRNVGRSRSCSAESPPPLAVTPLTTTLASAAPGPGYVMGANSGRDTKGGVLHSSATVTDARDSAHPSDTVSVNVYVPATLLPRPAPANGLVLAYGSGMCHGATRL